MRPCIFTTSLSPSYHVLSCETDGERINQVATHLEELKPLETYANSEPIQSTTTGNSTEQDREREKNVTRGLTIGRAEDGLGEMWANWAPGSAQRRVLPTCAVLCQPNGRATVLANGRCGRQPLFLTRPAAAYKQMRLASWSVSSRSKLCI